MVRPNQLLHAQRAPVPARAAATVLLLRDGVDGVEVLMTRRSSNASFAPGAYVFPGGVVDAHDGANHAQARRRPTQSDLHLTQAIAAIRESFEELGVLLAHRRDGQHADHSDVATLNRAQPLAEQCQQHGLTLAADEVFVLAHWTTDRDLARRFSVPFLVARMPEGQTPVADGSEQFEPVWVRPADALVRHGQGQFFMVYPTIRTLERLRAYSNVEAILQACAATEQPLWTSCPRGGLMGGRDVRYMEHELPYGELALVCPDGQVSHALDWQSETPVPLLKNLLRLTAPNPGAMTGPGTNSYLVGEPGTGYIAIDPGPADTDHLEKLWRAAGGDIRLIVCTHSHPDHSPGARPLQALCTPAPPILGLPSATTARQHSQFAPDRTLRDHELLVLTDDAAPAAVTHSLKVLYTPGHAANHICLLLLEDGLLFSGDHILCGSTTVIDPPDGDMTLYLESLDHLSAECAQYGVEFILPAHGHVMGGYDGEALTVITQLKAHRLKREAKVLQAMQALPDGTLEDWVEHAYQDVPPRLWPVAKRSLIAHVARIQANLS